MPPKKAEELGGAVGGADAGGAVADAGGAVADAGGAKKKKKKKKKKGAVGGADAETLLRQKIDKFKNVKPLFYKGRENTAENLSRFRDLSNGHVIIQEIIYGYILNLRKYTLEKKEYNDSVKAFNKNRKLPKPDSKKAPKPFDKLAVINDAIEKALYKENNFFESEGEPNEEGRKSLETALKDSIDQENPTFNMGDLYNVAIKSGYKNKSLNALGRMKIKKATSLEEINAIKEKYTKENKEDFFQDSVFEDRKIYFEMLEDALVEGTLKPIAESEKYVSENQYDKSLKILDEGKEGSLDRVLNIMKPFLFYDFNVLNAYLSASTEKEAQEAQKRARDEQREANRVEAQNELDRAEARRVANEEAQAVIQQNIADNEARRVAGQAQALRDAGRAEKNQIKSAEAKAQQDAQDILDKEAEDKARLASIADEEARKARVEALKRQNQLIELGNSDPDELTISKLDEDERTIVREIIQNRKLRELQFGKALTSEQLQAIKDKQSADFEARQAQDKANADAQAKALQAPKVSEREEAFKKALGFSEFDSRVENIKDKIRNVEALDQPENELLSKMIEFDINNSNIPNQTRSLSLMYDDLNANPETINRLLQALPERDRAKAQSDITESLIGDIAGGMGDYNTLMNKPKIAIEAREPVASEEAIGLFGVGEIPKYVKGNKRIPSASLLFKDKPLTEKQKKEGKKPNTDPLGIHPLDTRGRFLRKGDRIPDTSADPFFGGVPVSLGGQRVDIYHQRGELPKKALTDYGDRFIGGRTVKAGDFGSYTQQGLSNTLNSTGLTGVPIQRFQDNEALPAGSNSPKGYRKGTIQSYPLESDQMAIQQSNIGFELMRSGRKVNYQMYQ